MGEGKLIRSRGGGARAHLVSDLGPLPATPTLPCLPRAARSWPAALGGTGVDRGSTLVRDRPSLGRLIPCWRSHLGLSHLFRGD